MKKVKQPNSLSIQRGRALGMQSQLPAARKKTLDNPDAAFQMGVPLSGVPRNSILKVLKVLGGNDLRAQIARMGIKPGSTLKVRPLGSSQLVLTNTKKRLLCISRSVCEKIIVQKANTRHHQIILI